MRIILLNLFMVLVISAGAQRANYVLRSPSGNVTATVMVTESGHLRYNVRCGEKTVIAPSALSWRIDGQTMGLTVTESHMSKAKKVKTAFHVFGNDSEVKCLHNAYTLDVKESGTDPYRMEFRLYDDGLALRYVADVDHEVTVNDYTEFDLPRASVWMQNNVRCYEAVYKRYEMPTLSKGYLAGPPVTVKYDNFLYACITEGGLEDFGGMRLRVTSPSCLTADLSGVTRLGEYAGGQKTEVATPWRIITMGTLADLYESHLVEDVSRPLDTVFGGKTDWIRPGLCTWSWLAGRPNHITPEVQKSFIDEAAKLGIRYNLIDEGWSYWKEEGRSNDEIVQDVINYGKAKGVETLLWKAYPDRRGIPGIQTPEKRKAFFEKCKKMGVAGLKIDFFDNEDQAITKYYAETLREAAEYGLIINFHGSNKPTGLNRTFPNELTREGIFGMEMGRSYADQDVIYPFTRFLAGHADYTALSFNPHRWGNTTEAHQIAMSVIFRSPLRCLAADPAHITAHPAKNFIVNIPTTWDESHLLKPSDIEECVIEAKRKGEVWYVVALSGKIGVKTSVPLKFLSSGNYKATIICDGMQEDKRCRIEEKTINNTDQLDIQMTFGGGYIVKLEKG